MYWEWSELNQCWYLNRPNSKGDVAKMSIRNGGKVAVLFIYGEENRVHETHRFAVPEGSETEACNTASALYKLYLVTLTTEAEVIAVRVKDES